MTDLNSTDSTVLRQRLAAALRLYVGPSAAMTREMLSELTQTDLRTIKAHACAETIPTLGTFLDYCRVLPPEFAAAVLGLAGIVGVRKSDELATPQRALAELAESVSVLADALADGRIDHTEIPLVTRELREGVAAAEGLIARLEGRG